MYIESQKYYARGQNYENGGMVEDDGLEGISDGERKIQYYIYHSCYFVHRAIALIHLCQLFANRLRSMVFISVALRSE